MVERAWGEGSGGYATQQARGVISREAVMASLQQNRKHSETGLFTPTRDRSTAQSTLVPFSHPHILWNRALSAARRQCPHRRCHKKPSMPPISTQLQPLWSWETQDKSISPLCSVITLLVYYCGWPGTWKTWEVPQALKTKTTTSEKPTEIQYGFETQTSMTYCKKEDLRFH